DVEVFAEAGAAARDEVGRGREAGVAVVDDARDRWGHAGNERRRYAQSRATEVDRPLHLQQIVQIGERVNLRLHADAGLNGHVGGRGERADAIAGLDRAVRRGDAVHTAVAAEYAAAVEAHQAVAERAVDQQDPLVDDRIAARRADGGQLHRSGTGLGQRPIVDDGADEQVGAGHRVGDVEETRLRKLPNASDV